MRVVRLDAEDERDGGALRHVGRVGERGRAVMREVVEDEAEGVQLRVWVRCCILVGTRHRALWWCCTMKVELHQTSSITRLRRVVE